jgi:hypothetical protein
LWVWGNYCLSTRPYRVIENGAIYQFNLTFCAIVMAPVRAGSPTALKGADRFNKAVPPGFFHYFKRGRLRFNGGVGASLGDCGFLAIIVGEPAPTELCFLLHLTMETVNWHILSLHNSTAADAHRLQQ